MTRSKSLGRGLLGFAQVWYLFGTLRNWGLSSLKRHNFVTFRHILTKLGGKVTILLFSSCVKFHAITYTKG